MTNTQTHPYHVVVRHPSPSKALASAKRLGAKYGPQFAVAFDDMGISGFEMPFAVVSHGPSFMDHTI